MSFTKILFVDFAIGFFFCIFRNLKHLIHKKVYKLNTVHLFLLLVKGRKFKIEMDQTFIEKFKNPNANNLISIFVCSFHRFNVKENY